MALSCRARAEEVYLALLHDQRHRAVAARNAYRASSVHGIIRPAKSPSLTRNTAGMAVGLCGQAIGQGVNLLLLGRLAGAEALGAYSFAMALVMPVLVASNLGLRSQLLSDHSRSTSFSDYQVLRVAAGSVGFAVIVALAF